MIATEKAKKEKFLLKKVGSFCLLLIKLLSDSSIVAESFLDKSVNWCFVDGDHSYKGCKKDILAWLPKMADKSFFIFHDTGLLLNMFNAGRYGVLKALFDCGRMILEHGFNLVDITNGYIFREDFLQGKAHGGLLVFKKDSK